jgi:hypothetical protein
MRKIHDLSVIIDGTGGDSGLEGGQLNQFENDVERHLRECASTVVGKAVFTKIRAHGRVLMIPYTLSIDRFFKTGPINALSLGSYDSYRFGLGTAAKLGPFDLLHTNVVCFSPRRFDLIPAGSALHLAAGYRASDILFHELVHAGRALGKEADRDQALHGRLVRYENEAEYFAVLITNIHMSEIGRPSPPNLLAHSAYPMVKRTNIRADHGVGELPAVLTDSDNFLYMPENFRLVMKYWAQHPTIAPMIAASPARFNPVGTYKKWLTNGNAAIFQDHFWFPPALKKRLEDFAVAHAPRPLN